MIEYYYDEESVIEDFKKLNKKNKNLHAYLVVDKYAADESNDQYIITDINYYGYHGQRYDYIFIK